MFYKANEFQLKHLISLVSETFELYGPKKVGRDTIYCKIQSESEIEWGYSRAIMPFKKILFPDGKELQRQPNKIAIVGMPLCDIAALNLFLEQFKGSGLIPKREDILVVGSDCRPDDNCFCNLYDLEKLWDYDLFILQKSHGYLVESKGWQSKDLIDKCGFKETDESFKLKSKAKAEKFDLVHTRDLIDNKHLTEDYWQGIANNCFGCGACTTVCPLCFCFKQDYLSCPNGEDKKCLKWDSCFAADFSQIQFGNDMRPTNKDRLYNWYHHKFVRGPKELGHPLCVGCGRCITACPAHLNIHNVITSLNKKHPK